MRQFLFSLFELNKILRTSSFFCRFSERASYNKLPLCEILGGGVLQNRNLGVASNFSGIFLVLQLVLIPYPLISFKRFGNDWRCFWFFALIIYFLQCWQLYRKGFGLYRLAWSRIWLGTSCGEMIFEFYDFFFLSSFGGIWNRRHVSAACLIIF